jgi:hypothetical protein
MARISTKRNKDEVNTNTFLPKRTVARLNRIDDLRDRVDCIQRSQAYIQGHIAETQGETQTEIRALRDEVKTLLRYFLQR